MAERGPADAVDAARLAAAALAEDGARDLTTECVLGGARSGSAHVELRERAVVAGATYAAAIADHCGLGLDWVIAEGSWADTGSVMGILRGDVRGILRAERPLLNVLQRATGIATATRVFVEAVAGTACRVLHTRKTAPGLRGLDLTAVVAGGGAMHRSGLDNVVLVKDNHWRALELGGGTLAAALSVARDQGSVDLYVEVESLAQVEEAARAGATRLLVDNQDPDTLRQWAVVARRLKLGIAIEATGGITLANVRDFALAGADYVSVGALTHSVRAIDLALRLD